MFFFDSGVSLKVKHDKATSLGITVNSEIEDLLSKLPSKQPLSILDQNGTIIKFPKEIYTNKNI